MKRALYWVGGGCAAVVMYFLAMPWVAGLDARLSMAGMGDRVVPRTLFLPASWLDMRVRLYSTYWRKCVKISTGIELPSWEERRALQETEQEGKL